MQTSDEATFDKDNYIETGMPAEAGELFPGKVVEHRDEGPRQLFSCDNACALLLTCVDARTVRFRFAPSGDFPEDFSYAVVAEALDRAVAPTVSETESHFVVETSDLMVSISRDGLRIRIEDNEGNLISDDEKGFHWYENDAFGGEVVMMSREIQSCEHFYGLGDIPGHKNLRGQRRQLWGSDVYGYNADTNPLYKNIPFFIGVHHGQAYGIFFDNTFRSFFDFGG
ncbi:MAG: glycosyl hydrolase, partial [Akkermansiaceae bacterium]